MPKRKDIDRTGRDPKLCQSYSKSTQTQCRSYPVRGRSTCGVHGSSNKRSNTAATRNLEQKKLTRVARRLGTPHENTETLKAGVGERQVRIAEQTGAQFETVLTSLLTAIKATSEQMQTAATSCRGLNLCS